MPRKKIIKEVEETKDEIKAKEKSIKLAKKPLAKEEANTNKKVSKPNKKNSKEVKTNNNAIKEKPINKNPISFNRAIEYKPDFLVSSYIIDPKTIGVDGYINAAIINTPEGYIYDDYRICHITMDNIQIVIIYKRKEKKSHGIR